MARIITCVGCGQEKQYYARESCSTCYERWYHNGKPEGGPPQPKSNDECRAMGRKTIVFDRDKRMEEYRKLTRDDGLPREIAAQKMGISDRTVSRYEKALRESAESPTRGGST